MALSLGRFAFGLRRACSVEREAGDYAANRYQPVSELGTDEVAAGPNRNSELGARSPPDEVTLKIVALRFPEPQSNLRERPEKNEDHRRAQQRNGQP